MPIFFVLKTFFTFQVSYLFMDAISKHFEKEQFD